MRKSINLSGEAADYFDGTVFHGSSMPIKTFRIHPKRGAFFTINPDHARDYGPVLYRCRVILQKARIYSEDEANSDMEIDRERLIQNGFDGRIVHYNDGGLDVIAFYPAQIDIVGTRPATT